MSRAVPIPSPTSSRGTQPSAATDTSTTSTVTAAPLTASIIGDPTKTYDGTTSATLTQANFSLSGLVGPRASR